MRCARCMAELPEAASECHVCGRPIARAYREPELDAPTEVISLRRPPAHAEHVETDGRIDVRAHRPAPFAALISEALGLGLAPPSEVAVFTPDEDASEAVSEVVALHAEDDSEAVSEVVALPRTDDGEMPSVVIRMVEIGEPQEDELPGLTFEPQDIDPVSGDAARHRGGKSLAELEGWLDAQYARPDSKVLRASLPPRTSDLPPRPARASAPVEDGLLGPPPVRPESLPLSHADRHVRRAAELVLASLEAIDDNKIPAARNHLKLALEFAKDDPAYRSLEVYVQRLEVSRDPKLEALEKRAIKLEGDGDLELAVTTLKKAIDRAEEPQLLERLGLLLAVKQKKPEAGIEYLERAVALRPKSKGYAQSLDRARKLVEARAAAGGAQKPKRKRR